MATESWHKHFFFNLSEIMTFDHNSKYIIIIIINNEFIERLYPKFNLLTGAFRGDVMDNIE